MSGIHLFHLAVLICVVICGLVAYGFRAAKLRDAGRKEKIHG